MSRTPGLEQLLRQRHVGDLGHAGVALRAAAAQHQHACRRRRRGRGRRCARAGPRSLSNTTARPAVLEQVRRRGGGLDDRAVGREVAAQHGDAGVGDQRLGARPDHRRVPDRARRRGGSTSGRPVTVIASGSSRSRTSRSTASRPPARWRSSMRNVPAGCRSTSSGTPEPMRSKSSSVRSTPSRPAIASRWTTAFVDPPTAASATIALRNDAARHDLCSAGGRRRPSRRRAGRSRAPARAGGCPGPGVPAMPGQRHAERLGDHAPSSTRCPSCCSARGCGSSTDSERRNSSSDSVPARTSSREPPDVGAAAERPRRGRCR